MKKFWIMWTYVANFSERPVRVSAKNPAEAIDIAFSSYSNDFQAKAKFFVFETEPVHSGLRRDVEDIVA